MTKKRNKKPATGKSNGFSQDKDRVLSYSSHNCSTTDATETTPDLKKCLSKVLEFFQLVGINSQEIESSDTFTLYFQTADRPIGTLTRADNTLSVQFSDKFSEIIFKFQGFPRILARNFTESEILQVFSETFSNYFKRYLDVNPKCYSLKVSQKGVKVILNQAGAA